MRIPRKSLVASLTATLALGVTASALADGATDQVSQLSASINSPYQKATEAGKASLFSQVSTYDKDNAPAISAFPPEIVRIDFPAEMTYNANKSLPQCNPADTDIAAGDTDAAIAHCPNSVIGAGHAIARFAAFPQENNETELTVTVFNGLTSQAGQQDSSDIAGTDAWAAGNPTIILHAVGPLAPTTVTLGEIRSSPNGSDYGKQLNVTDAPDVANDAGALVFFNAQVARSYDNGKTGDKKKKYNLISATCPTTGDGDYDFRGSWTYDDATTDTDENTNAALNKTGAQYCTTKP
jgi:hypothetical protein